MTTRALVGLWAGMLALLAVSIGGTLLPALGVWRQVLSLTVALVKAALILWFFMELRRSEPLVRLAALGALTFLAVMATLFSADYLTRGWLSD